MDMQRVYNLRENHSLDEIIKIMQLKVSKPVLSCKLSKWIKQNKLKPHRPVHYMPTKEECQVAISMEIPVTEVAKMFCTTYYQLTLCEKAYSLKFKRTENHVNLGPRIEKSAPIDPEDIPPSKKVPIEIQMLLNSAWRSDNLNNIVGNY